MSSRSRHSVTSNLTLTPDIAHAPPQVTFRRNLRSLSPSRLSLMVSSALPSPSQFSALDRNSATDTLCFTLTSCLDNFCPLSSRPARTTPSAPWLSDVLREHRAKLRAAERKWHKSKNSTDLSVYQSHLSSFSANVSTAKTTYYHNKLTTVPTLAHSSKLSLLFSVLLPLLLHQLLQLMTLQFSSQIKQEPSVTNSSHHKLIITS